MVVSPGLAEWWYLLTEQHAKYLLTVVVTFIMVIHPAQRMPNAPTITITVITLVLARCSNAFKAFKNSLPTIHLHLGRVVDVDTCIAKGAATSLDLKANHVTRSLVTFRSLCKPTYYCTIRLKKKRNQTKQNQLINL